MTKPGDPDWGISPDQAIIRDLDAEVERLRHDIERQKDLPKLWRDKARAMRALDKRSPSEAARAEADAYEECAAELSAALSESSRNGD